MEFTFIEFNARRALRGAEAARVEVHDGEESCWLWMSERDIRKNMAAFGPSEELDKALAAYAQHRQPAGPALIDPAAVSAQLTAMNEAGLRDFEEDDHA